MSIEQLTKSLQSFVGVIHYYLPYNRKTLFSQVNWQSLWNKNVHYAIKNKCKRPAHHACQEWRAIASANGIPSLGVQ